jgi:dephospho-CoA kinase
VLILRKIAVTGGLASGKTTVCRILRECGGFVVDADAIVHRLLSPDTAIGQQVIGLLGTSIVVGNQINRKKIAKLVFSNPQKLKTLENILHPVVRNEIEEKYNQVKEKSYAFFVAEIPLLYEAKMEDFFHTVITVVADNEIARKRYGKSEEFDRRMARQETLEEKAQRADFTIVNNGDIVALKGEVVKIVDKLKENPI